MKNMQSNAIPMIIKPYRTSEKAAKFKPHRCLHKLAQGVETNFIFDLNVLSWMNEVIKGKSSLKTKNLNQLVKTMNSAQALSLSPGLALHEAASDWIEPLRESFEAFIDRYCPSYRDHPSAIRSDLGSFNNSQEFSKLDYSKKALFSEAYLAMLRLHILRRRLDNENGIVLFAEYLDYMSSVADIVGGVESEIAKYVLFRPESMKDKRHWFRAKKIRGNFYKWNPDSEKTLQNCLNITNDLMYYRLTAFMADQLFDGRKQENWLVTGDMGIQFLSESLFFYTKFDGSNSVAIAYSRNASQENSEYWQVCDRLSEELNCRRNPGFTPPNTEWTEKEYNRLLDLVAESEDEIRTIQKVA